MLKENIRICHCLLKLIEICIFMPESWSLILIKLTTRVFFLFNGETYSKDDAFSAAGKCVWLRMYLRTYFLFMQSSSWLYRIQSFHGYKLNNFKNKQILLHIPQKTYLQYVISLSILYRRKNEWRKQTRTLYSPF